MTEGSNTANMTVADRLAQKLRSSEMGQFLAEDDIIEIARDAIKKAFFEPVVTVDRYNDKKTTEPLLVSDAREVFRKVANEHFSKVISETIATEEFKKVMLDAMIALAPVVALEQARYGVERAVNDMSGMIAERVKQIIAGRTY